MDSEKGRKEFGEMKYFEEDIKVRRTRLEKQFINIFIVRFFHGVIDYRTVYPRSRDVSFRCF